MLVTLKILYFCMNYLSLWYACTDCGKQTNKQINQPSTLRSSSQAIELVKHLAEVNKYEIDSARTEDTIKLYQLLRVVPYEGLEAMWKEFAGNEEYRWVSTSVFSFSVSTVLKHMFDALYLSMSILSYFRLQLLLLYKESP